MECPLCNYKFIQQNILELISSESGQINCPNCEEIITNKDLDTYACEKLKKFIKTEEDKEFEKAKKEYKKIAGEG